MNRKIIGLLAVIMVLTLAACGTGGEKAEGSKEHVYKGEEIKMDAITDNASVSDLLLRGERMYLTAYSWSEDIRAIEVVNQKTDGTDSSKAVIKLKDNQNMSWFTADEQGDLYVILNEYFEDASDPDNYIWEDNYYLLKMDGQGNELWKQPLNGQKSEGTEEYYGVNWMQLLQDGSIGLIDTMGIRRYDASTGQLLKTVKLQSDISGGEVYQLNDGTIVANVYKSETNKQTLCKLDMETGALTGDYIVPGNQGSYSYYPGVGYDFLLATNSSVSGYNLGDEEVTELMNFIDSDLNSSYIYNIVALNEKEFYGIVNDIQTGEDVLLKFSKVDPRDVVDKKVITLACNGLNWEVRGQVVGFNKSNSQYRIQINDYSEYNTDDDYNAGVTKLNTDMASGKMPDMLVIDTNLSVDSYIAKGLFEDLRPYIEKDQTLNESDYFPNVLKAYETNGSLYQMIPSFRIFTVAGKTSEVGAGTGWTLEELEAVMAKKPAGSQVFTQETRRSILNYSMQMSSEQFIDWDTAECRFDSEAFISLLEFMKQFPEQLDDSSYDESFWNSYETMWRDGKVLLSIAYIESFDSYNYMKKGTFGEDITLKGFPSENSKGSAIVPNLDFAMSSKSKNKEGAWEFMRYFLTDEYQNKIEYGWPLSMRRAEELAGKAQQRPTYEDENGNKVEYDQTYFVGGVEVPISPMSQEETKELMDFVKSVEQPYAYDEYLLNIISEEAAPYFAGQKKAEDVAQIIQSRVQVYVNENR